MNRILVVYFSRSGFTGGIAKEVAAISGADIEEVMDEESPGQKKSYFRRVCEATFHLLTSNKKPDRQPASYDVIAIGTPIWCWNMSSPIRTYIKNNREQFKKVAFFCTYGGNGKERVFQDMEKLAQHNSVCKLALTDSEIEANSAHDRIKDFAKNLSKFASNN